MIRKLALFVAAWTALLLVAAFAPAGSYTYDSATGYYYSDGVAYTRTDNGSWWHDKTTNYDYCGRAYYTYVGLLEKMLAEAGLKKHVQPGMGHILFVLFADDDLTIRREADA